MDDSAFNRLNKRIELANRGLEKLDQKQKRRLKEDKVAFQIEGMKIQYLQRQNRELEKQDRLKKQMAARDMRMRQQIIREEEATRRRQDLLDSSIAASQRREAARRRAQSRAATSTALMGSSLALGAVGAGAWQTIKKASDARESENLLNVVFGDRANEMKAWSESAGGAMQRSKYQLQDYAGRFGAFLNPMLQGTGADVAGMSQQAAQLTVDLASFFNVDENEARQRVYSGLAGETEAVRKLGVDLSDAALESLNKQNGSTVAYNQLSMGEKTQLRFQKLMMDTQQAQGDAVRTANDFSNIVRRVQSRFSELAVEMGKNLLPLAKDIAAYLDGTLLPVLKGFGKDTFALRTAFEFLTVAVLGSAAAYAIANPMVLAGAAIMGTAFLIFDEFRTILLGGNTFLGEFFEWIDWTGRTGRQVWEGLTQAMIGVGDIIIGVALDIASVVGTIVSFLSGDLSWDQVKEKVAGQSNTMAAVNRARNAVAGVDRDAAQRKQTLEAAALRGDVETFGGAVGEFTGDSGQATKLYNDYRRQGIETGKIAATEQDVVNGAASREQLEAGRLALAEGMANQSVVYSDINVNIAGTNATPKQIEDAVSSALQNVLRQAAASSGEEVEEE